MMMNNRIIQLGETETGLYVHRIAQQQPLSPLTIGYAVQLQAGSTLNMQLAERRKELGVLVCSGSVSHGGLKWLQGSVLVLTDAQAGLRLAATSDAVLVLLSAVDERTQSTIL